ncbi:TolB family protein [Chitinophaga polysaccharea]|uniref:TolB family protein n=1 Tax=Chitinophaga polysaccharea TaxID=1293035 RepID=UPI00115B6AEC|nr:hypothetical protein [Chitinophaga polysaccharea]
MRDIPFSDWKGYASASPDGKKIALPLGEHIWLMYADGSDFHQITEGDQRETNPCFSPTVNTWPFWLTPGPVRQEAVQQLHICVWCLPMGRCTKCIRVRIAGSCKWL